MPEKQTPGSAGYDLFAAQNCTISYMEVALIRLGIILEIPVGYEAQIRSRSGLALKNKLFVLNSPGTIDSDYRQEVGVLLMNLNKEPFIITKHMRIAQMVFAQIASVMFNEISEISKTDRASGWGSTGL